MLLFNYLVISRCHLCFSLIVTTVCNLISSCYWHYLDIPILLALCHILLRFICSVGVLT